jgi:hypothetical protein
MPSQPHHPEFHHATTDSETLIMKFCRVSRYFLSLRPNYLPSTPFPKNSQQYQATREIISAYLLNVKTEDSGKNDSRNYLVSCDIDLFMNAISLC